ncbi:peptidase S8/S53 domain-containing protein [Butyriboletus roseoflavus]|nr:peptidase S8/S53 domain-containing protein [Butyriboletus roseoflavus]
MHSSSFISLVALTFALLSGAKPTLSPYNVHEKRTHIPAGWSLTRRHDATSTIPLRFALKQRNIEDIGDHLNDVSHPKSPNYGKHWTAADIARTFAPSDETIDMVRNWLITSGIEEEQITLGRTKGWIRVDVTVEEAEQLMNSEYNVYTHISGKEHVACEVYHLPEHVQPHVDFVTPSVHFDAKVNRRSSGETTSSARDFGRPEAGIAPKIFDLAPGNHLGELEECDKYITPRCLRALYKFSYEAVSTNRNSYGIVEYTPQAYLQSDLQLFAKHFSKDLIGKEPYVVSIDGGIVQTINQSFPYNAESSLDLQFGMSMVTGEQTVTLYQVGDVVQGASFNNFLDAIDGSYCTFEGGDDPILDAQYPDTQPGGYTGKACGTVKPANVISTSYGSTEAEITLFYAQRQCAEYAKLGLMGVTVLYSSGDSGVAGPGDACLPPEGPGAGWVFNPTFPGTCPYVTSVGATMVQRNKSVSDPEEACMENIYSGGGFSNYFAIPDYQKDAVGCYLKNHYPSYPLNIWNSTGISRGYPDISANGARYVVAVNDRFRLAFGTSCSSPVVGAIITMINDARLAVGKGPIGFINPTIYTPEFAGTFHDITKGSNPGCNTTGFNATEGWDPVTGLGTPDFQSLLDLWLSLP